MLKHATSPKTVLSRFAESRRKFQELRIIRWQELKKGADRILGNRVNQREYFARCILKNNLSNP